MLARHGALCCTEYANPLQCASTLPALSKVKMDPSTFFSLLFGSERFEPWIGELPGSQRDIAGLGRSISSSARHLAMQTDQFAKAMEKEGRQP